MFQYRAWLTRVKIVTSAKISSLRFPFAIQTRETSETASETLPQFPPIEFLVPKSETNRKGVSNQKASSSTRGVLKKKNVAFEASFSCVFGAGPHRIHPKTPSGQPQKRCTFAFQCIQHVLIAELHLAFNFQPFVKFPDSRNSAFKAFSEGAAVVTPVPVMVSTILSSPFVIVVVVVTTLSINVCRLVRPCLKGIWVVLVLSDVVFRGWGLDVPRKVAIPFYL